MLLAAPAAAQDAPGFAGARLEGRIGYAHSDATVARFGFDGTVDRASASAGGLLLGLGAGYDVVLGGRFVLGADAGIDWTVAQGSFRYRDLFGQGGVSVPASFDREIEAGARVGYRAGRSLLLYAKGAYANLRSKPFESAFTEDGWRVGGGWNGPRSPRGGSALTSRPSTATPSIPSSCSATSSLEPRASASSPPLPAPARRG